MTTRNWLDRLTGFFGKPTTQRRPRKAILRVEGLEERWTPAVGGLDASFGVAGKVVQGLNFGSDNNDYGNAVAVQADGKYVVVGAVERSAAGDLDFIVARYNRDGSLDSSFNGNGKRTVFFDLGGTKDDRATCVAIDNQGRIVVGGRVTSANGDFDFGVARILPNGSLDTTFDTDGRAVVAFNGGGANNDECFALALAGDKIYLAGSGERNNDVDMAVCRLNTNGSLDTAFSNTGKRFVFFDLGGTNYDSAQGVAVDALGRVVIAGYATTDLGDDFAVCRLQTDGSLDTTFSSDGKQTIAFNLGSTMVDRCYAVALQGDGKIILGGSARTELNGDDFAVARLNSDGSLENGFNGGKQTFGFNLAGTKNDVCRSLVVQPDGYILMAGYVDSSNGIDFAAFRMGSNGGPDWSLNPANSGKWTGGFNLGGTNNDVLHGVAYSPDGLVLVGSVDTGATNGYDIGILRLVSSNRVVISADQGGPPTVKLNTTTGVFERQFNVYGSTFKGGVRTAAGDINGDGIDEVFCAPGPGGSPIVKIYDGATLNLLKSIQVYGITFTKGVNLAVGDVYGDGQLELVVAPDVGGSPYVNIFDPNTSTLVKQILVYGSSYLGGVRVTTGDVLGDGKEEVLVAPEAGGTPKVNVFNAITSSLLKQIQAFDLSFKGGVYLATGKASDGKDDLYVSQGVGGSLSVRRFDVATNSIYAEYQMFNVASQVGLRVATVNATSDENEDVIAGMGAGGAPQFKVRSEDITGGEYALVDAFDATMTAGLFVSGAKR